LEGSRWKQSKSVHENCLGRGRGIGEFVRCVSHCIAKRRPSSVACPCWTPHYSPGPSWPASRWLPWSPRWHAPLLPVRPGLGPARVSGGAPTAHLVDTCWSLVMMLQSTRLRDPRLASMISPSSAGLMRAAASSPYIRRYSSWYNRAASERSNERG
jgi:hypothetical protein